MNTIVLLKYSMITVCFLSVGTLGIMWRRRLLRDFAALAALLSALCLEELLSVLTLFFRKDLGLSKLVAYNIYLYSNWIGAFVQYALLLLVIYSVFRQAMKPLEGLHRAGKIVFRWVCAVSLALSLGIVVSPHVHSLDYISSITGQIQQGISVLIICLLLFVCFSTRLLGLTYRSRIFGASLGLGIFATVSLVESAWYSSQGAHNLYSPVYLVSAIGVCLAISTWAVYFVIPEPERKMILLPTTSPFFLWNRISEALGDEPGFVAIAGFKPDMLAPAELTVLTAASNRLREREAEEAVAARKAETAKAAQHAMSLHPIAMNR